MLDGVRIRDIKVNIDERGFFSEIIRSDWEDFLEGAIPVQANISMNYPGVIKAWHRHARGQIDYLIALEGSLRICIYDDRIDSATKGQLDEIVVSSDRPQLVRIPGHYWHGTKTLGVRPSLTLYLVSKLYNYDAPDEERRPWDDKSIIDPRTGEPYDWNRPSNR